MSNGSVSKLYTDIRNRLDSVRRRENQVQLLHGVLASLAIALVLVLFVVVLESIFTLDTVGRAILFSVAAVGSLGVLGWLVGRPLLRMLGVLKPADNSVIALKVGRYFPDIRDRLLDALEMYEGREHLQRTYSVELIDASFNDLYEQIRPLEFTDAVSTSSIRRMRKVAAYAVGVFLLAVVVSPSGFLGSIHRIIHFDRSFAAPLPIQIFVEPGNAEVVRGDNVTISVRTSGKPVENLTLLTRQQGQVEFDEKQLRIDGGVFRSEIPSIKASTEYYAAVDDISSDKFMITVLDRPIIRSLQLKVTPPSYTRIPSKLLDQNVGEVSAYPGTKVNLEVLASKELAFAKAVFSTKTELPLSIRGRDAEGAFVVKQNSTYHIALEDRDGLPNVNPVEYAVRVVPDEHPAAEILSPGRNLDLTEEMKLSLFIRIKDDFGFSKLRLAYRLVQSRYERPAEEFSFVNIPLQSHTQSTATLWHAWDLSPLHLVPEDAVAYYVEVFDNDVVGGPKAGRSEMYIIRLPSLEEVFTDVSQSQRQSLESMQSVAKETQQLKRDMEELQREMRKNRDKMDWQQQKKAEELLKRYEALKQKLDDVSRKMDEAVKKMEDNKVLSDQTLEKYLELQKMMEQLKSPELQEALKKLQESMKQLSPEQIRQAMEKLKLSEEHFRQSLERTIELLKRIHIEQKIDELIKRAEELQKQQEALRQQTAQARPSDQQKREELSQQQRDLQQQEQSMEREASELTKKMEEFPKEMPLEQMQKAEQQLRQDQIGQKMQQSSQQMQSGDMQGAQQNQQESETDLSEFAEQMRGVQQALQSQQMKQIVNEMRKQLQNAIELSKRQEQLKDETRGLDPNSQRFREGTARQNELRNDLNNVANRLSELSKKTFAVSPEMSREMGNAMRQMDQAQENMENRNPGGSSEKQGEAMASLNRAAMMMQNALNGMQGGQGGMGMAGLMGRLGQMSGMQQGINQGTQQAMGMGEGQGLSAQQQAEYARLAAAQGAAQKALQDLAREAKDAGEFSKLLGDLDKIAQDMGEVQTDLEQGNVNPNTMQKQERILSRLLDSQRSMRERDYEKRRRADPGRDVPRTSPAEIDLATQEGKNKLRQELLKILDGKYSKDYEVLIKRYFDQLEKTEIRQ